MKFGKGGWKSLQKNDPVFNCNILWQNWYTSCFKIQNFLLTNVNDIWNTFYVFLWQSKNFKLKPNFPKWYFWPDFRTTVMSKDKNLIMNSESGWVVFVSFWGAFSRLIRVLIGFSWPVFIHLVIHLCYVMMSNQSRMH